jgi:hypothetical protein
MDMSTSTWAAAAFRSSTTVLRIGKKPATLERERIDRPRGSRGLVSAICERTLEAEVPRRGLGVERAAEVQASSTSSLTTMGN